MISEITINYNVTLEQDNQIKETIYNYFKEKLYRATFYDYDGRECDEDKLLIYWDNDDNELLDKLYFSHYRPRHQYVKCCIDDLYDDVDELYAKCLWEQGNKDIFIQAYTDEDEAYMKFLDVFTEDKYSILNMNEVWDEYIWSKCNRESWIPTVKEKNRLVLTLIGLEPECCDEYNEVEN